MKIEKALQKLKKILNADRQKQMEKSKSLRKVLKGLQHEKDHLQAKLQDSDNKQEREEIAKRLKVVKLQTKKGKKLQHHLEEQQDD